MSEIISKSIIVNKFNEESAKKFREQVLEKAAMDPNMPILVYIDSYGGYVDALNSMLATMRQVPNKFVTCCIGKAMSCGAVLLSAGDYRYIDQGARVMIHQTSGGTIGPTENMQNDVNEGKRLNKQLMDFILGRCDKTMKEYKQKLRDKQIDENDDARELYLDAKESLDFGIVDFIGMPIIKPMVMYSIEVAPEKEYEAIDLIAKETLEDLQGADVVEQKAVKKQTRKKTTKKKTTKKKTTKKKATRRK